MKKNHRRKLLAMLGVAAACMLILGLCLTLMQSTLTVSSQRENTAQKMETLESLTAAARETAQSTQEMFDEVYVLSGRWTRSVNIFSLTASLMVICVVSVASMLVQRLLMLMARVFDAHTATVCRLLVNLVRYISIIAELYYCFALFGVDTATLLALAGILTLVIGIGAKELVSDILAGLFIIFEGEFRVGDIVTIGDCRGTVLEIGVRTTKIEIPGKNIKIINNSSISGVINMTRQYSFASCTVGIEYGESLERVEAVLKEELPRMRERLPAIKDGPFYKGVTELADSSVNIMILALCAESDRIQLGRDLNREMKLILDRNNINIPFPQVVLNYRDENGK